MALLDYVRKHNSKLSINQLRNIGFTDMDIIEYLDREWLISFSYYYQFRKTYKDGPIIDSVFQSNKQSISIKD